MTGLGSETCQGIVYTVLHSQETEVLFTLQSIERPPRDLGIDELRYLIVLRQELWSVLLYQRPFRLPISLDLNYAQPALADDFVWVNRIILWCADILRFCFGPETSLDLASRSTSNLEFTRYDAMKSFEQSWDSLQPSSFIPLYYEPPDPTRGAYFPVIWYLHDCQIQGMQHLELGRMLLAVFNPRRQRVGIGSSAMNHAIEHQLRRLILRLCGITLADKSLQAGKTTAALGISIGGEYFHDKGEQDDIIGFLEILEKEHAWPTKAVVYALQEAWGLQRPLTESPSPNGPASV